MSLKIVFRARNPVSLTAGNVVSPWLVPNMGTGGVMFPVLKSGILTLLIVTQTVASQWQRSLCK